MLFNLILMLLIAFTRSTLSKNVSTCHFQLELEQRCNRDDPNDAHVETYPIFTFFLEVAETPIPGVFGDGISIETQRATSDVYAVDIGRVFVPDRFNLSWKYQETPNTDRMLFWLNDDRENQAYDDSNSCNGTGWSDRNIPKNRNAYDQSEFGKDCQSNPYMQYNYRVSSLEYLRVGRLMERC
jgi:hypothetical protein